MSRHYLSNTVRQRVAEKATHRCGYCQTQAAVIGDPLEIDHINPHLSERVNEEDNLWLACSRCNKCKGQRIDGVDPVSEERAPLFNPQTDRWATHFRWSQDSIVIEGLTATGRVTIALLRMNAPMIQVARKRWVQAGWHPPKTVNISL